jgi:uncharacterized membrane protein HdeD (DUF308 family)
MSDERMSRSASRKILKTAVVASGVAAAGVALGHPAVAFVASGVFVVWLAVLVGSSLVRRLAVERDRGRELMWNLLLAGVVLLALVGVGLMAAPLT